MKKQLLKSLALAALITIPSIVHAENFFITGKVTRTMIHNNEFGKCMVAMSIPVGNGCTGTWISLDCEGKYLGAGDGDRMLNVALLAQNLGKNITAEIDNTKLFGGKYCIAKRVDLLN